MFCLVLLRYYHDLTRIYVCKQIIQCKPGNKDVLMAHIKNAIQRTKIIKFKQRDYKLNFFDIHTMNTTEPMTQWTPRMNEYVT